MAEDDCTGGVSSLYLIYRKKKEKGFLSGYNCVSEMGILVFFHFARSVFKKLFSQFRRKYFSNIFRKGKKRGVRRVSILIQSIVNGLNQGAIYALIALGYTMVYGILRMINFAHGDFIMVGAYTMFYTVPLMVSYGMPAWMAVFAAVAVCTAVGVLVERIAYKPVRNSGSISALITALAMSLFLENLAMVLFGGNPKTVTKIFDLP